MSGQRRGAVSARDSHCSHLTHPHILPLIDSGESGGVLFYVMPYIEGETLRERIARMGELPIPESIRILRHVTDALAYAHARGVIHRDIKPENVLLSDRHALVADFGVAKALRSVELGHDRNHQSHHGHGNNGWYSGLYGTRAGGRGRGGPSS
jgi:serine/threonine protein kinase